MSRRLSRRSVLGALAGTTGITATGLAAAQQEQDWFDPDVEYTRDGMVVTVRGEGIESVTLYTRDGGPITFEGGSGQYGYTRDDRYSIDGWQGMITETVVSNGDESAGVLNPRARREPVIDCSRYEPQEPPSDVRLFFEHATKTYDPPAGDSDAFGAPGRPLQEIEQMGNEMAVQLEEACAGAGDPGVEFHCTSVTVHPHEFVNGPAECHDVELTFADGSTETRATDTPARPPQTFRGSGENEGKVIESIGFSNDEYGATWFHYENPDLESCSPGSGASEESAANETEADAADTDGTETEDESAGAETTDGDAGDADPAEGDANETDTDGGSAEDTEPDGSDGDGSDGSDGTDTGGDSTGGDESTASTSETEQVGADTDDSGESTSAGDSTDGEQSGAASGTDDGAGATDDGGSGGGETDGGTTANADGGVSTESTSDGTESADDGTETSDSGTATDDSGTDDSGGDDFAWFDRWWR